MSDHRVVILPPALLEMRQWAGEQKPDVRDRVLRLCDALKDCGMAHWEALEAIRGAQRLLADVQADVDRLLFAIGGKP